MGFGGINAHVVLEGTAEARRDTLREPRAGAPRLLAGRRAAAARRSGRRRPRRAGRAPGRSWPAAPRGPSWPTSRPSCAGRLNGGAVRAAVVAAKPAEAADGLRRLAGWLRDGREGITARLDALHGVFLGSRAAGASASSSPARAPPPISTAEPCAGASRSWRRSTAPPGSIRRPIPSIRPWPSPPSSATRWRACGCSTAWACEPPWRSGTAWARSPPSTGAEPSTVPPPCASPGRAAGPWRTCPVNAGAMAGIAAEPAVVEEILKNPTDPSDRLERSSPSTTRRSGR